MNSSKQGSFQDQDQEHNADSSSKPGSFRPADEDEGEDEGKGDREGDRDGNNGDDGRDDQEEEEKTGNEHHQQQQQNQHQQELEQGKSASGEEDSHVKGNEVDGSEKVTADKQEKAEKETVGAQGGDGAQDGSKEDAAAHAMDTN
jgi:hypothetical protein